MANTFRIKRSAVQGKVPAVGDLQLGELAVNTYDGRLFTKKDAGGTISIVEIGASSSTTTFASDISLQNQSATRYYEASANGTNYIAIKAPSSLAADVTLILPPNDGDPDQVLGTDGNGTLSWVSRVSGSGTSGDFLSASTASEQSGYFGNIYLKDDANTSHYLEITNSDDLTASRTLSVDVNDANRSITLSGNISLANSFTTSGNFGLTLTTTGLTDVTLPTSGTLAVNNQTMHIGTTAVAINRASGSLALTGITSIDGSAATLSTTRTLWGQNFNGSANVTGSLTSVGNITGTGAVTLTATSGALNLTATGANEVAVNTNGVQRVSVASNGLSTFGSQAASGAALTVTAPAKLYTGTGTYTDSTTAASGTVTHGAIVAFDNPTISATNTSVTYTDASTVYIDGAPTAGTNVTLTNAYSLYVNAGVSLFGGSVRITGLTASQAVFTDANDNLVSNAITGSGNVVMSASPTLTGTPISTTAAVDTNTTQIATTAFVVGQASATNPLALGTAAVGTSLRYSRQDHVHPTTGLGLTSGTLGQFAATTSAQLAGVISDETGSGALVFATSPTLSGTPLSTTAAADTNTTQIATTAFVVGQASATNPLALGSAAVGTSLRYSRQDHVHPTTGLGLTSGTLAQFAATTSAQLAGVISDETGSGALVFATSPSLTTPNIGAATGTSLSTTGNITNGGFDFVLGTTDQASRGNTGNSRALVKDTGSILRVNYAGDFGGGVIVDGVGLTVAGNLTVNGTTTTVNSTTLTIDDPIITLGGDTSVAEVTKDRGVEFKWNGTALTITNYIGNGTTTVTGTVASTSGYAVGDIITISGATGAEQTKLNGTWAIASVPTGTTFTFVVTSTVAAGTYTTTLGTTVKSKNGFFGLDQSTGRFTFIPQSSQSGEVYSGTVGDIDVGNGYFSGNVGVGEPSPASKLTVRSDSAGGRGGEISIVNYAASTVGNEAALNFGLENSTYNANNGNAQIKARVNNVNAATDLIFSNWSGSAFNETVRILSSGSVGIGTISPGTKLHIEESSADCRLRIISGTASDAAIQLGDTASASQGAIIYDNAADALRFQVNGSERARIDSSGNIGVSDPSPSSNIIGSGAPTVVLRGTSGAQPTRSGGVCFISQDGTSKTLAYHDSGIFYLQSTSATAQVFFTNNTERLRITAAGSVNIVGAGTAGSTQAVSFNGSAPVNSLVIDSSGRVGLGTSSPADTLDVRAATATGRFEATGGTTPAYQSYRNSGGNFFVGVDNSTGSNFASLGYSAVLWQTGARAIAFGTNNLTRAVIDSSGNVGIGTTSPSATLDVNGNTRISGGGIRALGYYSDASSAYNVSIGTTGNVGYLQAINVGNTSELSIDGSPIKFRTGAFVEAVRIDSSGRLLVGTSTARTASIGGNNQVIFEAPSTYFNQILASNTNSTDGSFLCFIKSRGTTAGSHTVVNSGDDLGLISFEGTDGTVARAGVQIRAQVDGTPGSADMPGRLVFSTTADGSASPTERMRLTSDGRLGLGTSSPGTTNGGLDIASGGLGLIVGADGSLSSRTNATNKQARIGAYHYTNAEEPVGIATVFSTASSNAIFFGGGTSALNAATALEFYTAANTTTTTGTQRMVIDSSGRVGVGTTSPGVTLDLSATTAATRITSSTGTNPAYVNFNNTAGNAYVGIESSTGGGAAVGNAAYALHLSHQGAYPINFSTNNALRATIDSSGRLLVGTSSSSSEAKLLVQGGSTGSGAALHLQRNVTTASAGSTIGYLRFANSADNAGATIVAEGDGTWTAGTSHPTRLVFSTTADGSASPTERMRIDSSGRVGIGTTGPQGALHIQQLLSNTVPALAIGETSNNVRFGIYQETGYTGTVIGDTNIDLKFKTYALGGTGGTLSFWTGTTTASERARIDSSGRLLVGASSSVALLGFNSGAQFATSTGTVSLIRNTTDNGATELIYAKSRGTISAPTIVSDGDGLSLQRFAGYDGATYIEAARISAVVDGTPGANDMPGRLVFSTTADGASSPTERMRITSGGNVGIGTTNPGYKLEVVGSFAATTKSFVIPHPIKPDHKLRYGSLEGPENGVYVRGRSKTFVIELPEYWTKLVDPDSITVNLTPIGKTQTLWVESIEGNKVYVRSKCAEVEYFYTVFAERADVDKLEVEVEG